MSNHTPEPYFPQDLENYAPWVAQYGLTAEYGKCQCGCGQDTKLASKDRKEKGWRADHPKRFAYGHNRRQAYQPEERQLCACGCGQYAGLARDNDVSKGQVRGQARRYIKGHQNKVYFFETLKDALYHHCNHDDPNQCWLWTGPVNNTGYGLAFFKNKQTLAPRSSWEVHNGPIPDGMYVLHRCDTPACINPAHLFLGTAMDNTRDMIAKGRAPWQKKKSTAN